MKRGVLLFIFAICLNIVQAYSYPILIKPTTNPNNTQRKISSSSLLDLSNAISTQEIELDVNALCNSDVVSLNIGGENIIVDRINVVQNETKDYIYCAYESNDLEMSISKLGNNIQGIINTSFGSYIIETVGDDSYILVELDTDEIELDGPCLESDDNAVTLSELANSATTQSASSDMKYVRVLVMYTTEALALASNMTNKVYQEINNGNTSFKNSGINVRFELAYVGQTEDSESNYDFSTLLSKFRGTDDGFADEVHSIRERYAADVCVLLVYRSGYCGMAKLNADKNSAFAVVKASSGCAIKYSFTHEIGHNAGCRHDTLVDSSTTPYKYAHGYVHYTGTSLTSWRTMMAYGDACNGNETHCQRIKYWSNPDVSYNGNPTGDETWSNNAKVWENNATNVSTFNIDPTSIAITSADNSTDMDYACWRATQSITANNYTVESGQTVEMLATSSITLLPGTTIKAGAKFRAAIASQSPITNYPQFAPKRNNTLEQSNDIDISIKMLESNLNLKLSLEQDCKNATIRVYDILGRLQMEIISDTNLPSGEHSFSTNLNKLNNGVYLLVTQIDNKNSINKFAKF